MYTSIIYTYKRSHQNKQRGVLTMNELTRLYGFKKNDFRYETDYTKVVSFASRIGDNYVAIISMCSDLLKCACQERRKKYDRI